MNCLIATADNSIDFKSSKEIDNLCDVDENYDSGCDEDDFVLRLSSSDDSDFGDGHSKNNCCINLKSAGLDAKHKSNSTSSIANSKLNTSNIYNISKDNAINRNTKRKKKQIKILENQTTLHKFFTQRNNDSNEFMNFSTDNNSGSDSIVNVRKLIMQLPNARVILKRLPESYFNTKNKNASNDDQFTLAENRIKRYCSTCKRSCQYECQKQSCPKCETMLDYECIKCGIKLKSSTGIKYHQQSKCFCKTDYKCSECDYSHPLAIRLARHMQTMHKTTKRTKSTFTCYDCFEKFSYMWELMRHREMCKINHGVNSIDLKDTVSASTTLQENLHKFDNSDADIKIFTVYHCSKCNKSIDFTHEQKLKKNCADCDAILTFICKKCNKNYNHYPSLRRHLLMTECNPRIISSLQCTLCNYNTTAWTLLLKHYMNKSHKDEDQFTCHADYINNGNIYFGQEDLGGSSIANGTENKYIDNTNDVSETTGVKSKSDRKRKLNDSDGLDPTPTHNKRAKLDNSQEITFFLKIFCPKCSETDSNEKRGALISCSNCKTQLHYECTKCKKLFDAIGIAMHHIGYSHCFSDRIINALVDRADARFTCKLCRKNFKSGKKLRTHIYCCSKKRYWNNHTTEQ